MGFLEKIQGVSIRRVKGIEDEGVHAANDVVLCVDLDGTVFRGDLLHESFVAAVKYTPSRALWSVWELVKSRARCKRVLATEHRVNLTSLPWREEVLEYVRGARARGVRTSLVSASDEILVAGVARALGCFDEWHGSNGRLNLKGRAKRDFLESRYGRVGFDYIGDSWADLAVWQGAQRKIVVGSDARLARAARRRFQGVETIMSKPKSAIRVLFRTIRLHQWVKNFLVFVPLLMAHAWDDPMRLLNVISAFLSFSLCASSVYVINDLLDLESDRQHHKKKHRPLAAGDIGIPSALSIAALFLVLAATIAWGLGEAFVVTLSGYFGLTFLYSVYLKRIALVDIIILASLYSLRLIAGGYAANVIVSQWLIAFSMFLFFSLACVKRYSEIQNMRRQEKQEAKGRGYTAHDLEQVSQFGAASGYIAILVLALYINSREVTALYSHSRFLWLICPLLFYWISRVWLLAGRGKMDEDPIVFALGDQTSYLVGVLSMLVVLISL